MKTISDVLRLSTEYLQKKSVERARRQVEELLSHVLKIPRLELYLQFDKPLVEEELDLMRKYVRRRAEGEPAQYICGSVEFLDCQIRVTQDVLIPRPETEILVDRVVKEISGPKEIWDLCTGSGCIGIAVKKKRPDCHVVLVDISSKALEIAQENGKANGVSVEILQGDLLTPLEGRRADVVVCNPPYIAEGEWAQLDPEVRHWEPKEALIGGKTGFEFYERLAIDLPRFLNRGAKVYFEIGRGMGEGVKRVFSGPLWKGQEVIQDWSSHDRYYILELAHPL
jgi:release factor glutamine methyltransferase